MARARHQRYLRGIRSHSVRQESLRGLPNWGGAYVLPREGPGARPFAPLLPHRFPPRPSTNNGFVPIQVTKMIGSLIRRSDIGSSRPGPVLCPIPSNHICRSSELGCVTRHSKVRREELMAQHHPMQCSGSHHNAETNEAMPQHVPIPIAGMDHVKTAVG